MKTSRPSLDSRLVPVGVIEAGVALGAVGELRGGGLPLVVRAALLVVPAQHLGGALQVGQQALCKGFPSLWPDQQSSTK